MRAQDIIRAVLDLIDNQPESVQTPNENEPGEQTSRFKQILDLISKNQVQPTANTPNEQYASVDAVTTIAGGGVNGSKHPADIRIKDPRFNS